MPQTTKSTKSKRAMATRTNARRRASNMSNNRNRRFVTLVILLAVALVGVIGVAVAAFSTNLYVRGTATVRSTVWDIHFENLQEAVITGSKAKVNTKPTIQTSVQNMPQAAIKEYDVELKDPGDAIEFTFDVKNGGDLDAVLNTITMNTGAALSCSSTNTSEATKVCAKLNYTLTYANNGAAVSVGDKLDAGVSKTMKLKLEFDSSATADDLPSEDVMVSGLAVILNYGQDTSGN